MIHHHPYSPVSQRCIKLTNHFGNPKILIPFSPENFQFCTNSQISDGPILHPFMLAHIRLSKAPCFHVNFASYPPCQPFFMINKLPSSNHPVQLPKLQPEICFPYTVSLQLHHQLQSS
uniref:Uncharacterized protein n=1 Tax=Opuntia streptacantha TaxID=393608 RepID=A0A7C9D4T2_OPUST